MRKLLAISALVLAAVGLATADEPPSEKNTATVESPAKTPPPPTTGLTIKDADPKAQSAISLDSVNIAALINGPLAQTTVTLVFHNSLNRPLEGNLEFPLPENATICNYALDIPAGSGTLIDGVAVEKERARRIFETEENRKVDPGIIEQTRGNNFQTRIYPIPANGSRTVRIQYVSEVTATKDAATYSIPLTYNQKIKNAQISIKYISPGKRHGENPLDVAGKLKVEGLNNFTFMPDDMAAFYWAEKSFSNIELTGSLTIKMPAPPATLTRVERRTVGATEERYFLVSAIADPLPINRPHHNIQRIGVIWDNSLSRLTADKTAERAMLKSLAANLKNFAFSICTTSDPEAQTSIQIKDGDATPLFNYLDKVIYDGALRLDSVVPDKVSDGRYPMGSRRTVVDFFLLFSDGLVTLGQPKLADGPIPVYTVNADPKADHALLHSIAQSSGGNYLNLATLKPEAAAKSLLERRCIMTLTANPKEISDIYPKGPITVIPGQRIIFTGKLLTPEAHLTLSTGDTEIMDSKQDLLIKQSDETTTGMIPRQWANQKIADLSAAPDANEDELTKLGKGFNLVTPYTSLIVLETVDQYLRYHIAPPKTAAALYKEFSARIEQENQQKRLDEAEKITHVLALWKQRTDWWETKFEYPKDFAFQPKPQNFAGLPSTQADAANSTGTVTINGGTLGGTGNLSGAAATTMPADIVRTTELRDALAQAERQQESVHSETEELTEADPRRRAMLLERRAMIVKDKGPTSSITIKPWSPDTPYLKAMAAVPPENAYAVFLEQRKDYLTSPAFYLDCANFLLEKNRTEEGIRVLTDIAQLRLESAPLLRIAAYRLLQIDEYDLAIDLFEKAKHLRPDEPQSWRDLALAHAARGLGHWPHPGDTNGITDEILRSASNDLQQSMDLLQHVIMNKWDRFDEIEVTALMEANEIWCLIQNKTPLTGFDVANHPFGDVSPVKNPLDPRLLKNLDCDIRIVLTWDADETDIDLHVIEPSGEEAFYKNNRTTIGGLVSHDFTQGYGPEEYCLRHAMPGKYKIQALYYGSRQQSLQGPVTVQATVITNFARPNESRQSLTLRLTDIRESQQIGEITIAPK